jgi:hypothetical protein
VIDLYHRSPMSSAQFLAAVTRFEELHPGGIRNSGWRGEAHNAQVGGGANSKHLAGNPLQPISCDIDYTPDPTPSMQRQMEHDWRVLGGWGLYHKGHMHTQGLPVGPIPEGWKP